VSVIDVLSVDNAGNALKAGNYLYHLTYPDSTNPSAMYTIFLDGITASPDSTNRYPNPFSPSLQGSFTLDTAMTLRLEVYNVEGKLIHSYPTKVYKAGEHIIRFDDIDIGAGGLFFWTLKAGDEIILARKMVVLK